MVRRLAGGALCVAGLTVLAWILWAVGWPAIQANVSLIGAWFAALVALYLFAQLAFMAGWWLVIDPSLRASGFLGLFGVYLAGDAVNYLIPSGNLAGEPVKADLLRHSMGFGGALTSITLHKHAELLAQWMFLVVGLGVALWHFELPALVTVGATVILCGLGVGLLLLTWVLRRGTFLPVLQRMAAWRPLAGRLQPYRSAAEALDVRIQSFYREQALRFAAAMGWCLVGWCGGLVETYLLLRLLSPTAGWTTAVAVETLAMTVNSLLVFIPGRVGSAEGARVGVCLLLGLPAAQGVAYGLARRGRELIWIVPGLLILLKRHAGRLGSPALSPSPSENTLV